MKTKDREECPVLGPTNRKLKKASIGPQPISPFNLPRTHTLYLRVGPSLAEPCPLGPSSLQTWSMDLLLPFLHINGIWVYTLSLQTTYPCTVFHTDQHCLRKGPSSSSRLPPCSSFHCLRPLQWRTRRPHPRMTSPVIAQSRPMQV